MLIKFRCPLCSHKLRADSAHAGRRAACGKCRRIVTIPAVSTLNGADNAPLDDEPPVEPVENGASGPLPRTTPSSFSIVRVVENGWAFPPICRGRRRSVRRARRPVMIPGSPGGESFLDRGLSRFRRLKSVPTARGQ